MGLMSGTSMDGVDAAVVEINEKNINVITTFNKLYDDELKQELILIRDNIESINIDNYARLDHKVGKFFGAVALSAIEKSGIKSDQIQAIGNHGQTIRHQPRGRHPFSLQIGDPNLIANATKITTVSDFRRRDIASGGEGAPLTPIFHKFLLHDKTSDRVVLNIGGISNITFLKSGSNRIRGFDTGPGNTLMDLWIKIHLNQDFDKDGGWARGGNCDLKLLEAMLSDPYFSSQPPKSTGFEYFNRTWIEKYLNKRKYQAVDVMRTLLMLTIESIALHIERHANSADEIIICGGGAKNKILIELLTDRMKDKSVSLSDHHGIDADYLEAVAFAFLAKKTLSQEPGNIKSVTGARDDVILGGIYLA